MDSFIFSMQNAWLLVNYDKNTQKIVKWVANIFMFVSAFAMSVSLTAALHPLTYVGFLIAGIIWAFYAVKIKDNVLFAQFLFCIPVNIYAMYIRL